MSTHADLIQAVQAWAAENYPGLAAESVSIRLRGLPVAVRLAVFAALPAATPAVEVERRGPSLHPCTRDILETLRAAGRPLSKTLLLEALARRNHEGLAGEWSESTVCRRLAELMEDGTITNPPDARPRGYRLEDA